MKTEDEIRERKHEFVEAIGYPERDNTPELRALRSAIKTAVSRTVGHPVYTGDYTYKIEAINFWKSELTRLGKKYKKKKQTSGQFINDVLEMQHNINEKYKDKNVFTDNGIRIGQCQKSFSIYLKWLWCENEIKYIPPVCPIDRVVLRTCREVLKRREDWRNYREEIRNTYIAWSALNNPEMYKTLVKIVQKVCSLNNDFNKEPAVWELFNWRREN